MSLARALLLPFGVAYGAAGALRAALYRGGLLVPTRLDAPVISIGNLSVGGSGKTPFVAWLATRLRERGLPVAILSRGYGGSFAGECLIVSEGGGALASADVAGDEPVLHAREQPGVVVAVGPRRDVVGRKVLERFGRRVLLLDDGFQHLRLHRELDIVCLAPGDARDWPMPAGRLREFSGALARAQLRVAVVGSADPPVMEADFVARRRPLGWTLLDGSPSDPPRRALLVSGIARPERFAADARALGSEVVGHRARPDHHRFDAAEIEAFAREARELGADSLLTTAKDAVRWPRVATSVPTRVLQMALEVAGEVALMERVMSVAKRAA